MPSLPRGGCCLGGQDCLPEVRSCVEPRVEGLPRDAYCLCGSLPRCPRSQQAQQRVSNALGHLGSPMLALIRACALLGSSQGLSEAGVGTAPACKRFGSDAGHTRCFRSSVAVSDPGADLPLSKAPPRHSSLLLEFVAKTGPFQKGPLLRARRVVQAVGIGIREGLRQTADQLRQPRQQRAPVGRTHVEVVAHRQPLSAIGVAL